MPVLQEVVEVRADLAGRAPAAQLPQGRDHLVHACSLEQPPRAVEPAGALRRAPAAQLDRVGELLGGMIEVDQPQHLSGESPSAAMRRWRRRRIQGAPSAMKSTLSAALRPICRAYDNSRAKTACGPRTVELTSDVPRQGRQSRLHEDRGRLKGPRARPRRGRHALDQDGVSIVEPELEALRQVAFPTTMPETTSGATTSFTSTPFIRGRSARSWKHSTSWTRARREGTTPVFPVQGRSGRSARRRSAGLLGRVRARVVIGGRGAGSSSFFDAVGADCACAPASGCMATGACLRGQLRRAPVVDGRHQQGRGRVPVAYPPSIHLAEAIHHSPRQALRRSRRGRGHGGDVRPTTPPEGASPAKRLSDASSVRRPGSGSDTWLRTSNAPPRPSDHQRRRRCATVPLVAPDDPLRRRRGPSSATCSTCSGRRQVSWISPSDDPAPSPSDRPLVVVSCRDRQLPSCCSAIRPSRLRAPSVPADDFRLRPRSSCSSADRSNRGRRLVSGSPYLRTAFRHRRMRRVGLRVPTVVLRIAGAVDQRRRIDAPTVYSAAQPDPPPNPSRSTVRTASGARSDDASRDSVEAGHERTRGAGSSCPGTHQQAQ